METKVKSKALQQFQEATETLVNPELKKWIEQGGKVMALFCSCGTGGDHHRCRHGALPG